MLDRPQQLRVFLANDLVKLRGLHPGLDQLLEGLAGLDALMLANVADEQHAVAGIELGNVADLHRRMDAAIKGYPYAKAAVEFAFYDLTGRALRLVQTGNLQTYAFLLVFGVALLLYFVLAK